MVLPAIRLACHECSNTFIWEYDCLEPGARYTKQLIAASPSYVLDSTIKHASGLFKIPYSTVERYYKKWSRQESARIQDECFNTALHSQQLILALDDFAIRKGHNYNTGVHDLRGDNFLDVIPGRKIDALTNYLEKSPLKNLDPKAIVMDLARSYHSFVAQVFPNATRVADRFHVNRYVLDALQETRKAVAKDLPAQAKKDLKTHHKKLSKRYDQLSETEIIITKRLLSYDKRFSVGTTFYEIKNLIKTKYCLSAIETWFLYKIQLQSLVMSRFFSIIIYPFVIIYVTL